MRKSGSFDILENLKDSCCGVPVYYYNYKKLKNEFIAESISNF